MHSMIIARGNKHRTTGCGLLSRNDSGCVKSRGLTREHIFKAGQIIVHRVYGDVGLEINDASNVADTPEIGLGTLIASGAVATLGAVGAGAEDLWGPHVVAGCDTGADATDAGQFVSTLEFVIADAAAHLVHLNCADTWGNGAGTANVVLENDARFVIDWTILPLGGI